MLLLLLSHTLGFLDQGHSSCFRSESHNVEFNNEVSANCYHYLLLWVFWIRDNPAVSELRATVRFSCYIRAILGGHIIAGIPVIVATDSLHQMSVLGRDFNDPGPVSVELHHQAEISLQAQEFTDHVNLELIYEDRREDLLTVYLRQRT